MFKIFGFAVIITVTSLAGNYFSSALKIRCAALRKMNYMLDEMIMLLRFRSPTVYEIVQSLRDSGRFEEFGFLDKTEAGVPFQQSWLKAVEKYPPAGMKKSDLELLSDIGRKLGTSDTESQINTLGLQQAELAKLISDAESDCNKKSRLYRSMGVLAGAFISIMLI